MKMICRRCGADFQSPDRRRHYCDSCGCEDMAKRWRQLNPDRVKERERLRVRCPDARYFSNVKSKYGLSRDAWERLRSTQDNVCWICQKAFVQRPEVDHSHTTGRVRGLLCGACNRAIGLLEENPNHFERAVKYLTRVEF